MCLCMRNKMKNRNIFQSFYASQINDEYFTFHLYDLIHLLFSFSGYEIMIVLLIQSFGKTVTFFFISRGQEYE